MICIYYLTSSPSFRIFVASLQPMTQGRLSYDKKMQKTASFINNNILKCILES